MYYAAKITSAPKVPQFSIVKKLISLNATMRQHRALASLTAEQLQDVGLTKADVRAELRRIV